MILIADSGSTKTSWCLLYNDGRSTEFSSEGYNPCYVGKDYITQSLIQQLPEGINPSDVTEIAFYGAGCYEDKYDVIKDAMAPIFPSAEVFVAMDLTGSARALLGDQPGFAAILGTGTNTCLYDGEKVTHNIDSLGFILGDEGSGGYIGKRLIGDYIRGYMPDDIRQTFWKKYKYTPDELIDRIYTGDMPNRFCAGFTRFITEYDTRNEYLDKVVEEAFYDFFYKIVCGYPDYTMYKFNCVGTIGWIFRDTLAQIATKFGMSVGKIISEPMEGLIAYHSKKLNVT